MNEELNGKLVEILNGITKSVSELKDFSTGQLPSVVEEFLAFSIVWETFISVMFLVILLVLFFTMKRIFNFLKNEKGHVEFAGGLILVFFICCISFPVVLAVLVYQLKDTFMVWFSPKIYLLYSIADMIK